MSDEEERIKKAVEVGLRYGQTDGAHHKAWVIDQMLRRLLGADYVGRGDSAVNDIRRFFRYINAPRRAWLPAHHADGIPLQSSDVCENVTR